MQTEEKATATAAEPVLGLTTAQAATLQHVIMQIPAQVARMKAGRLKFVHIYKMPRHEYQPPFDTPAGAELDPDWIKGVSRRIYDHCIGQGYKTTVECVGWSAETYITVHA